MQVFNTSGDACKELEFQFDSAKGNTAVVVRFDTLKELQQAILALGGVEKQWRETWRPGQWTSIVLVCRKHKTAATAKKKAKR